MNMGYCRFRNTVSDMADCVWHIDDDTGSPEEEKAREEFIRMCVEVAESHGEAK